MYEDRWKKRIMNKNEYLQVKKDLRKKNERKKSILKTWSTSHCNKNRKQALSAGNILSYQGKFNPTSWPEEEWIYIKWNLM